MPYNDAGRDYWKDPKMREQLGSAGCFSSKFVIFTGSKAESIKSFRHQMARFYEQYYKNLSLGPRVSCSGDERNIDKPLWMCIQWHMISNDSGRNGTNYSDWFRRKFDVGSLSRVSKYAFLIFLVHVLKRRELEELQLLQLQLQRKLQWQWRLR